MYIIKEGIKILVRRARETMARQEKPHAVCIPCPAQGHINAMLQFAKLLHWRGFHITFVHTEHSYSRILASSGPSSLDGLPDFRFETIPDGPWAYEGQVNVGDLSLLIYAVRNNLSQPFRQLLKRLDESGEPKVSCIISDTFLSFTLEIAAELGIPDVSFCSVSACGFWGCFSCKELVERGLVPLKDEGDLNNEYLDAPIDWIPGMNNIRFRDLPGIVRTTNPDDVLLNFTIDEAQASLNATAIVMHTFEELEGPVLEAMSATLPPVYAVGPLSLMCHQILNEPLRKLGASMWKEDSRYLDWLDGRESGSVIYVNFGSLTVITRQQLIEFAWGLANSGRDFLWVIRPDVVTGDSANIIPEELLSQVGERGLLASWCHQEQVLMHRSIGGFLTHCGWNSTMESIGMGVPMICWPFFADQQTNCRYVCNEWGIGLEINSDVKREEVEMIIKELFGGRKGADMRRMAFKWKESAGKVAKANGKSFSNLDRLIKEVLEPRR